MIFILLHGEEIKSLESHLHYTKGKDDENKEDSKTDHCSYFRRDLVSLGFYDENQLVTETCSFDIYHVLCLLYLQQEAP